MELQPISAHSPVLLANAGRAAAAASVLAVPLPPSRPATVNPATLRSDPGQQGEAEANRQPIDWAMLPPDTARQLKEAGATDWSLRSVPQLDDAELQIRVREGLRASGASRLAGFDAAIASGTLTVERASRRPDLGYRSYVADLYDADGDHLGGAGFSVFDAGSVLALRMAGTYVSAGTLAGTDYVVSWPMRWDDDADWLAGPVD